MGSQPDSLPAVDAILSGPYWPGRVRVIRAGGRVRLDVVTLDEQSCLISRNFNRQELQKLVVETEPGELALDGAPCAVSIAGAILWVLEPEARRVTDESHERFQSRGRFFGCWSDG